MKVLSSLVAEFTPRTIILFFFWLIPTSASWSYDLGSLQRECASLGFKVGKEANGKCVLDLIKKQKSENAESEAQSQRLAQQEYEYRKLREREILEMQRRDAAAAERAAAERREAMLLYQMNATSQQLTNSYGSRSRQPITCINMGMFTDCR